MVVSVLSKFGRQYCAPKFFGLLCLLALLPFLSFGATARASGQAAPQAALLERPVVNAEGDSANTASRDTTAVLTDGAEAEIPVPEAPVDMPPPDFPPPPPGPEADPAFFDPFEPHPEAPPLPQPLGFVAHCFDGDTFKLTDRRIVRLAGIDAPELSKGDRKGQLFAREARDQLTGLTQGLQVMLLQAGVKHRDMHGRILAEVLLPDGTSLNELMVRNGAAYFYPHRDLSPQLQERLRNLQHEAIAERRGMWGFLLSQPVAKNTYLGNKESLRFFPADCAEAQSIRPRNRVYFGNLMDAFMAGYAPARVCPFWPVTP